MTALEGTTRLRIRNVYNAQPASSCSSETWGETEDYSVVILPAPPPTTYTWNKTAPDSIHLAANWTPARTFPNQNDILRFNSGGNVTVLNINNTTAGQVIVDNNTTVNLGASAATVLMVQDSLKLISGKLVGGNNVTIALGKDTLSTGVLTGTGSIHGAFRRWISNTTPASYVFPLIETAASRNAMIEYTTIPVTGGTLTATFVSGPTSNGGLPLTQSGITVNKIAPSGYWTFTASNGLGGGLYTAAITASNFAGVANHATLVLVKRNNNLLPWSIPGTHVTTIGSNTIPVLSRTGLGDFGDFGVGGDSSLNPLPINLISFNGYEQLGDVMLNWITANEQDNKGFIIERKSDGEEWKEIGWVDAMGSVNMGAKYQYIDYTPFTEHSTKLYYRLQQVDLNGDITYSKTITISSEKTEQVSILPYPNPFTKELSLAVQTDADCMMQTEIFDFNGKMIWKKETAILKGLNTLNMTETLDVKPGVYVVKVSFGDHLFNLKLTKL